MTTVQTRAREISNKEGFEISVKRRGKYVKPTQNGVLGPWPHRNKTRGNYTAKDFREKFEAAYPGYSCDILSADGTAAHGNAALENIRSAY